ncbi:MAG: hypothetical protein RL226_255, partial [Bacteroidota bacterium]
LNMQDREKIILAHFQRNDPFIAGLIMRLGPLTYPLASSAFETLVHAIIGQQLSVKAADTIHRRFLELIVYQVTPSQVLRLNEEDLRSVGISRQKASYLYSLAEHFSAMPEKYNAMETLDDEEIISLLTAIKGIGRWTAEMYLMFNLCRDDVFPFDDLGIRQQMERHYSLPIDKKPNRKAYEAIAEKWRPYRSIACRYLWNSKDKL